MRMSIFLPCIMLNLPAYRAAEDLTVSLPSGETYLGDIGIYRVTYQSYDKEPVAMPLSWTGHFTTETGISYLSSERILGRSAILLHSPWRVPPGKVWVDYLVRLPEVTPIVLSFGIAMAPDVAVPGRSDGVTFSAYLLQGDQNLELMRQHQAKAEWKDYRFNLTQYAGQVITLRLQTEPGPKNDPSWDYSYFGDAKISAGPEIRAKLLQRLLSAPAYQATEKLGMLAMANSDRQGIVPGNLLKSRNSITKSEPNYRFMYHGKDGQVVYTYRPKTGTLDDFTVQVDNGRPFQPARGGGVTLLKEGEETLLPASGGRLISAKLSRGRAIPDGAVGL